MNPRSALPALLWALALAVPTAALDVPSAAAPEAKAAFARLKSLAGDWEGHTTTREGPMARVEFRVVGNGSAIAEREYPDTPREMLTVYYLDGADLVLNHYCVLGNQPRLRLVEGGAEGDLRFDFVGGTNVDPRKDPHMHGKTFKMLSATGYDSEEPVENEGKVVDTKRFFMTRVK